MFTLTNLAKVASLMAVPAKAVEYGKSIYYRNLPVKPLPLKKQQEAEELVKRMGFTARVVFSQYEQNGLCRGSDLPYGFVRVDVPLDASRFILAHELAHAKLKHSTQRTFFAVFGTVFLYQIPALPTFIAFLAASTLLGKMHEKQADLMACDMVNKNEIAQIIKEFDSIQFQHKIERRMCENKPLWDRVKVKAAITPSGENLFLFSAFPHIFGLHPTLKSRIEYLTRRYEKLDVKPTIDVRTSGSPEIEILDEVKVAQIKN